MPKGPQGEKRPADVIGNTAHVMRITTGEIEDVSLPKSTAAERAQKGGKARAAELSHIGDTLWIPMKGAESVDHGIWIVNTATGQAYYYCTVAGPAVCMEALFRNSSDVVKAMSESQPKK